MKASQAYKKLQKIRKANQKDKIKNLNKKIESRVRSGETYTIYAYTTNENDLCTLTYDQLEAYLRERGYKVFKCMGPSGWFAEIIWGPEDQTPLSFRRVTSDNSSNEIQNEGEEE